MSQTNDVKTPAHFPTFRRWFARLGKLPFAAYSWFKRNARRMAFACLFLVALWTAANIYATFALNRELAAIKQRGEPLTWAELKSSPVPDSENAALLYEQARKKMNFSVEDDWLLSMPNQTTMAGEKLTPDQVDEIRAKVVRQNGHIFQLLLEAARLKKYDSRPILTKTSMSDDENSAGLIYAMRKLARLMSARAIYSAQRGNTEQAFQSVAAIYRMSEQVSQKPITIPMLVGIAIENSGHETLARVLDVISLSPAQAQNFESQFPRSDWRKTFQRAMQGERIYLLPFYTEGKPMVEGTQAKEVGEGIEAPWWMGNRIFFGLTLPLRKLDAAVFLRSDPTQPVNSFAWYQIMSSNFVPSFQESFQATGHITDVREMARIALTLKLWKQMHNSYPKSLQELKSIPIASLPNALKRKTIGYKTQGDKFLLYGFGLNRRDDGGKSNNYDPLNPDSQIFGDDDDDFPWRQSLGVKKQKN